MQFLTDQNKFPELKLAMEKAEIDILGISVIIKKLGEIIIQTKNDIKLRVPMIT